MKLVTRDAGDPRRYNKYWETVAGLTIKHHTVAPTMRNLTWKGVADPRVTVIEERNRELFAEGGQRMNDHLRFNIPFKGEPGSAYPNGIDHIGQAFGSTTCFALPSVERAGRP